MIYHGRTCFRRKINTSTSFSGNYIQIILIFSPYKTSRNFGNFVNLPYRLLPKESKNEYRGLGDRGKKIFLESVSLEEKKARLIELQALQKKIQGEMNKDLIGQTLSVLSLGKSTKDPHIYSGRSEAYQVINFSSRRDVTGQFIPIRITGSGPYSLRGEVVNLSGK